MRRLMMTIAFAASLLMHGALAEEDRPQCNGVSGVPWPKPMVAPQLARIIGRDRAFFQWSLPPNCLSLPLGCRAPLQPYVLPGDIVAVAGTATGFVCAEYFKHGRQRTRIIGWLPSDQVALDPPDEPTWSPQDWAGTWKSDGGKIILRAEGGEIRAEGHAIWVGRSDPHFGEFSGSAVPKRNSLAYGEGVGQGACEVVLRAFGDRILAIDNMGCGGTNVSFSGIYARPAK